MAYKEIFNLLETADEMSRNIAEQIKNPTKDYSYGQTPTDKPQGK